MYTALPFPSPAEQFLSSLVHFGGVALLSHCLSKRAAAEDVFTLSSWCQMSWPRLCVLLIFLDSWLFVFSSGILIFGVGLNTNSAVCSAGIYICIAFYATSKVLIYLFLAERVHVAWQGNFRRQSPLYLVSIVTVMLYAVVVTVVIIGRVQYLRSDGVCIIGLKSYASIGLLSYDLYINLFLTTLFLWPLFRRHRLNPQVRRVTSRTLIAALAALTTSAINIAVLTFMKGQELGWVCLGSCSIDVLFNAVALFWVSTGTNESTKSVQGVQMRPVLGQVQSIRAQNITFTDPTAPSRIIRRSSDPAIRVDILQSPQSIHSPPPKAPLMTPYSNLEILSEFQVEKIDSPPPKKSRFSRLKKLLRHDSQGSRCDPVMSLSQDTPSMQIHVTRETNHQYMHRAYGYDSESQRIYPRQF